MALKDSLLGTTCLNLTWTQVGLFWVMGVIFGGEEETATSTGLVRDCSVFPSPYPPELVSDILYKWSLWHSGMWTNVESPMTENDSNIHVCSVRRTTWPERTGMMNCHTSD